MRQRREEEKPRPTSRQEREKKGLRPMPREEIKNLNNSIKRLECVYKYIKYVYK